MSTFTIIPAIDLKDGHCVRLRQGLKDQVTTYSADPAAMARHWRDAGAELIHVVDLDGAFEGHPVHQEAIAKIAAAVDIPIEIGGGLRTDADIQELLDCGAARVILGTRACSQPDELGDLVARFGDRVVVGIDARDGMVRAKGWVEATSLRAIDLARQVDALGVATLIYTDTATDGMLQGPNIAAVSEICDGVSCSVIASGGVTSAADVAALVAAGKPNMVGAIVGKALYDEKVTMAELTAACAPVA